MSDTEKLEIGFNQLADQLVAALVDRESLTISLNCERSQFTRFNRAKVRQTGVVADGNVELSLICDRRKAFAGFPFTGEIAVDLANAIESLAYLRQEVAQLPEDPYAILPENRGSSRSIYKGELLPTDRVAESILRSLKDVDFAGFYAAGSIVRANANSAGQKHWFATDTFSIDYSMFTQSDRAVKGAYAGSRWQQELYEAQIDRSKQQLSALNRPAKTIPRGQYRTYFTPDAVAEIVGMLRGAASEADLQQGSSPFLKLRQGERKLSPLFDLNENFKGGTVPRFNDLGEIAPEQMSIIQAGELVNPLVSARTAKEYNKTANGADSGEYLRAPEVSSGNLGADEILAELGTGLYLSNLHYLNFSDRTGGRITGMTRYACFWVEDGEMIAPIENLRFDDSIYDFLGENLEALTNFQEFILEIGTYGGRSLGGTLVPGMLINNFTFTL